MKSSPVKRENPVPKHSQAAIQAILSTLAESHAIPVADLRQRILLLEQVAKHLKVALRAVNQTRVRLLLAQALRRQRVRMRELERANRQLRRALDSI